MMETGGQIFNDVCCYSHLALSSAAPAAETHTLSSIVSFYSVCAFVHAHFKIVLKDTHIYIYTDA